jgi:peptidoglycan/xylan/chitin deacetylase (PgdA/CDA1 family)
VIRHGRLPVPFRLFVLCVVLTPLLVACGADDEENDISWTALSEAPAGQQVNANTTAAPTGVGGPTSPLPTVPPTTVSVGPGNFLTHQPNELGVVPVLEYHMITTNPEEEEQFVRTADDMRADLQWLYDHNFYIVPLRDVVNNSIAVPAGKHPVALTFDDGSSTQFAFTENESGELVPDPNSAIGILEEFSNTHPDFGRGGHFAILINNQLAWPDETQMPYFDAKIQWLVEHGYEIGNHTMHHTNLTDISNNEFKMTLAEPMIWADEVIGDRPENAFRILTLPYGSMPNKELHPDQRRAMRRGFTYQGERYKIIAALLVGADPAVSPASTQWDPLMIPRIQAFDESLEFWFGQFESGDQILYTSDGDPETIVVPDPLPGVLEGHLDVAALTDAGKQVIQYDPGTGQVLDLSADAPAAVIRPGQMAARPGRALQRSASDLQR